MRRFVLVASALWALAGAPAAFGTADSVPLVFTLDSLSMISIDDRHFTSIPTASLTIHAYPSGLPGVAALRIQPGEFGSKSVSVSGTTLSAALAGPATGSARRTAGGALEVEIQAVFRVSVSTPSGVRSHDLPMRLTTESVEAWSADGKKKLDVDGLRVNPTSRVLQLVGRTIAGANDPVPGAAVYVVLSGVLDRLPTF